ncbi:hypothetical protein BCF11_2229 [Collimonas sp. PA-H2]|jgi:hypothetical protein|nr:hypothetical protein [Collimonas sp. PA-H2]PFH09825.1 hypothetical protein BCF11_2229 [Collimonas sp. PA-H2]
MSEPAPLRLRQWLAILLGGALLLALLAACFRAYLRPDFLLELISSNLMC